MADEDDMKLTLSASGCHIDGPNSVSLWQFFCHFSLNSRHPKLKQFARVKVFRKLGFRKLPKMSQDLHEAQSFSVFGIKIPIFFFKLKVSENELTKVRGKTIKKTLVDYL